MVAIATPGAFNSSPAEFLAHESRSALRDIECGTKIARFRKRGIVEATNARPLVDSAGRAVTAVDGGRSELAPRCAPLRRRVAGVLAGNGILQ